MNYTDIENFTSEDETIINWRKRRGRVQLRCPKCDEFFNIPEDITVDEDGYLSDKLYHMCGDLVHEENNDGWVVLAHLVDWGV